MSDGDDDAWVSLGAIATQVMEDVARPGVWFTADLAEATAAHERSVTSGHWLRPEADAVGNADIISARYSAGSACSTPRHSGTRPELKGVAPAPQGGGDAGAGALAETGANGRARHSAGGGTSAVILIFVPRRGRARPNTSPATMGELHRITEEGRTSSWNPPDAVRLVNARRAKLRK